MPVEPSGNVRGLNTGRLLAGRPGRLGYDQVVAGAVRVPDPLGPLEIGALERVGVVHAVHRPAVREVRRDERIVTVDVGDPVRIARPRQSRRQQSGSLRHRSGCRRARRHRWREAALGAMSKSPPPTNTFPSITFVGVFSGSADPEIDGNEPSRIVVTRANAIATLAEVVVVQVFDRSDRADHVRRGLLGCLRH